LKKKNSLLCRKTLARGFVSLTLEGDVGVAVEEKVGIAVNSDSASREEVPTNSTGTGRTLSPKLKQFHSARKTALSLVFTGEAWLGESKRDRLTELHNQCNGFHPKMRKNRFGLF
jgi:hypothetical protein